MNYQHVRSIKYVLEHQLKQINQEVRDSKYYLKSRFKNHISIAYWHLADAIEQLMYALKTEPSDGNNSEFGNSEDRA